MKNVKLRKQKLVFKDNNKKLKKIDELKGFRAKKNKNK